MGFKNFTPTNKLAEVEREVATAIARVAYFISPNIVRRLAELNQQWGVEFRSKHGAKTDAEHYFYVGSACVFPGARRQANEEERKLALRKYHRSISAIVDDNVFPRHLWSFVCVGKSYSGPCWKDSGLGQFELAHVLPHKVYEVGGVKGWFAKAPSDSLLNGLFSCAANVILIPKGMAKPTDGTNGIRLAVLKRYFDLYGDTHAAGYGGFLLPKHLSWVDKLEWNTPVEPPDWEVRVAKLDEFRRSKIDRLFAVGTD